MSWVTGGSINGLPLFFCAKPLPEQILDYCPWDSWEHISMKFDSEFYHFIQENAFKNVICQIGGRFVYGEIS